MAVCCEKTATAARENTRTKHRNIGLGMLVTALASSCTPYHSGERITKETASPAEIWSQTIKERREKKVMIIAEETQIHGPYEGQRGILFFETTPSIGELFPSEEPQISIQTYQPSTATSTYNYDSGNVQQRDRKYASHVLSQLPFLDDGAYAFYGLERKLLSRERWEDPEKNVILYDERRSPLTDRERRSGSFIEDYDRPSTAIKIVSRAVKELVWAHDDVGVIHLAKESEKKAHKVLDYFNPLTLLPINGGTSVDPYIKEDSLGIRFRRGVVSLNVGTNHKENNWLIGFYVEH
ncbi:MAG: hypothetical protein AABW64_02560 [Nanoarchaeota archaeon]